MLTKKANFTKLGKRSDQDHAYKIQLQHGTKSKQQQKSRDVK